jgi:hypothetical protein
MNSSYISHAIPIGIAAIVMLAWIGIVSMILRLTGIQYPGRKQSQEDKAGENLRELSKPWHVFVSGIVLWGWPFGVASTLYDYVENKYLRSGNAVIFDLSKFIEMTIFYSVLCLLMGLSTWKSEKGISRRNSSNPTVI